MKGITQTHRWTLPNKLVVLYRQDAAMPLAAATLLLRVGSRNERPDQAGLCNFTIEMLLSGTRRRSASQIADVVESVGGSMGAQAAEDYAEVDWLAPAVHAGRLLDLLADVVIAPRWPDVELKKQRQHILNDLKTRPDVLFNVAYDGFRQRLFKTHAYARPVDGTEPTVRRFTRKDLAAWHAEHVRPDRAIFSLAGPWPLAEARRLVRRSLGGWRRPKTPVSAAPQPVALDAKRETAVLTAAFQQAYFMSGSYAPPLAHPDVLPLKIWNMVLGGGMSSRLFVHLREERGLAYEVSSFYPARLDRSAWAVYMGLPAERLPEAEQTLNRLLEELAAKGPTATELAQAKRLMEGTYLMDHQTRRRQAWYAAWWEFLGRPTNYDTQYLRRIATLTLAEVRAAGRRLLAQPRLTVKVVPNGGSIPS